MLPEFEQFIKERQYLYNVSPATVSWHTHNLKWLPSMVPTQEELKQVVVRMREKGLRATGCNSAIRSINACLKWSGSPLKIPQIKEPQHVLPTHTPRLSAFIAFIADTGRRIDEALSLHLERSGF